MIGWGSLTSADLRVSLKVKIRYELRMYLGALKWSQAGVHYPSKTRPEDYKTPQRAFQYAHKSPEFHAD